MRIALAIVLACACGAGDEKRAAPNVVVGACAETAVALVDERMLSYAIDTSTLVDVDRDFGRARLRRLTQELAPAYLRFGGTPADGVYYDVPSEEPTCAPPAGYDSCVTGARLRDACDFASAVGAEIVFTLNAGCGPRDAAGAWTPDLARALVDFFAGEACPVAVFELGNEVDLMGGPDDSRTPCEVDAAEYADDYRTAKAMLASAGSSARLAGPASLFAGGTGLVYFPEEVFGPFLENAGEAVDVVTWHWYPQWSCRCDIAAPIETTPENMVDPARLDELSVWADPVEAMVAEHAPGAELWLGESGNSLCGGQPCVSDRYGSGFWWLDELGQLARRGERVVVRQALTEGRYHLVDDTTLEPLPDYWTSVLWKRLVGTTVLDPCVEVKAPLDPSLLRVYGHCTAGRPGAVTVIALNLDPERALAIGFEDAGDAREVYRLTAGDLVPTQAECRSGDPDCVISDPALQAQSIELGGVPLVAAPDGAPPAMDPEAGTDPISIPPRSYAFIVLPEADAPACL